MLTNPLRYENVTDSSRRLNKSIVKLDGKPVFIDLCSPNLDVRCLKLLAWDKKDASQIPSETVHSSDIRLDLESPPLGWANVNQKGVQRPIYFLRTIARQYCQGVVPQKTFWIDPSKTVNGEVLTNPGWSWRTWQDILPFFYMIAGINYPSIEEVLAEKNGGAFDRDWALIPTKSQNIRTLYSEFKPVGYYDVRVRKFYFGPGHLTKVRRMSLEHLLYNDKNGSTIFGIEEHA